MTDLLAGLTKISVWFAKAGGIPNFVSYKRSPV